MAFVPLTSCTVTLQGAQSGQRINLSITKATAVGMVTFSRDTMTFAKVNEAFFIADVYTGDAVNVADYLEIYINGQTTSRRILGGIMKTAPTGANRMMEGVIPAGQLSLYWQSA
jgi:hypothetical protein